MKDEHQEEALERRVRERTAELTRPNEALRSEIARREQAQETLGESDARYRDLFENANDVIYTLDLEGRVTSVNKRAERTIGYTPAEVVGRSAKEWVAPEHHARMEEALRRKLAGEEAPTVYELEV